MKFATVLALLLSAILTNPFAATAQTVDSFYVSPTGTDSGFCVASAPCKTIQYATDQAEANNPACSVQTIYLTVGKWHESVNVAGHCNQLWYIGAGDSTIWNGSANSCGTLVVNGGANVVVSNFQIRGTGSSCQSSLYAQVGGIIQIWTGMTFGGASSAQINCENSASTIVAFSDYTIINGASFHIATVGGCSVGIGTITVTIQNGPTFITFISVSDNSVVDLDQTVFSGPVDGTTQYYATRNGVIDTFVGACGNIPGNVPGTTSLGGICF